ncbi:MAG: PilZ domain-containing protein [Nannocystales bacterium]
MVPPSQPTSERRAFVRVPHRVRAILSTRLGEVAAEVVDLSEGGVGVEISGELRSSDFVRVLLPLAPGDDSSEWVDPDALVARVHGVTGSGRRRIGLSFFQLPADTLRRIAACVASGLQAMPKPAPSPNRRRPAPAATTPPPSSKAITRELPKPGPAPQRATALPRRKASPAPKTGSARQSAPAEAQTPPAAKPTPAPKTPPLHIPRTSARELRDLFHEALASLEEDTGGKKKT